VHSLADGTITFTASATDVDGNSATGTISATKDTVSPVVTISFISPSMINAATASSVSAIGTTTIGSTVTVVATDSASGVSNTYNATVDSSGSWTAAGIDVSGLADGTITITATAMDATSHTGTANTTVQKDTVPPAITIAPITNTINAANDTSIPVSGTTEIGATVKVVATDSASGTTTIYNATVDSSGNWSVTGVNTSGLADGTITFTATATDEAGNTTQKTTTATKNTVAPTITFATVTNPITPGNATSVSASGTTEIGDSVLVFATDSANLSSSDYLATVDSSGNWTVSGMDVSALANGTITFTATAQNAAGNTAAITLTATKVTT
jgi:hypothetical protein